MDIHIITTMKADILRLTQSLDSLFPIGSYTLSNGMETYVQKGIVYDRESLEKHLAAYLYMLSFNDLAFAVKAYNGYDVKKLDELCGALKAPEELRSGSIKQCIRFLKLHTELDNYPKLTKYKEYIEKGECDGHYCIAMGLFIKEIEVDIAEGLELYCYSILSTMANHAVKLVPLRQLDGQKALLSVMAEIPKAVERAMQTELDEIGACGCGFDIRSMQHEKLYSRLYIS
jgi:urease accessory protein